MWPWIVLAPAALGWAVLRRPGRGDAATEAPSAQAAGDLAGAIWFVSSYAIVSLSMTKFHHYVLPAIPGLAIVIGCFLDDLIERRAWRTAAARCWSGCRCCC